MRALSYAHRLTHIYSRCRTSCLCRIESLWTSISLPLQMAERFRRAQPDSVANNVKARQSLIERSVTWLATESGWVRRKRSAICSVSAILAPPYKRHKLLTYLNLLMTGRSNMPNVNESSQHRKLASKISAPGRGQADVTASLRRGRTGPRRGRRAAAGWHLLRRLFLATNVTAASTSTNHSIRTNEAVKHTRSLHELTLYHRYYRRRSQDLSGGALFFLKKLTTFFSRRLQKTV